MLLVAVLGGRHGWELDKPVEKLIAVWCGHSLRLVQQHCAVALCSIVAIDDAGEQGSVRALCTDRANRAVLPNTKKQVSGP